MNMPRKPNPKTRRHARPGRKSVRQSYPGHETEFKKSVLKVRLDAFQIAALKSLAKEHGTTLAQEFDNAVDAYLLGMRQGEVRMLNAVLKRFNESMGRSNKVIDAALRKTEKNLAHLARKKRSGLQR